MLTPKQVENIKQTVEVVLQAVQHVRGGRRSSRADPVSDVQESAELLRAEPAEQRSALADRIFTLWGANDPQRFFLQIDAASGRVGPLFNHAGERVADVPLDLALRREDDSRERARVNTDPRGMPLVPWLVGPRDELKATIVGTDVTLTATRP
jgi:hypothetical protein